MPQTGLSEGFHYSMGVRLQKRNRDDWPQTRAKRLCGPHREGSNPDEKATSFLTDLDSSYTIFTVKEKFFIFHIFSQKPNKLFLQVAKNTRC